ncbi:Pc12g03050 [Penicillium rubens Wisconsin 54-1255]|uniref:Pc12g03050 protein n=1 Tax=Penicillium rubens (strain ATCC 28089 / DSM 1075 / NRRL 1951 / Wisconsin 54-1255) TaxID=500485 RepID=B6H0L4_PENRW|nr:Pc12g03050 [Penicillium rubens Wisconsin 54-1255]
MLGDTVAWEVQCILRCKCGQDRGPLTGESKEIFASADDRGQWNLSPSAVSFACDGSLQRPLAGKLYSDLERGLDYVCQILEHVDTERAVALGLGYGGYSGGSLFRYYLPALAL